MWAKIWKSRDEQIDKDSDCLPHQNDLASEAAVTGKAREWTSIDDHHFGQENCKGIKSGNEEISTKDLESLDEADHDRRTKSSFLHAVINMVGMLIGNN